MKGQTRKIAGVKCLITYPDGYVKGEKYPLLFLMCGAGTRGKDVNILKDNPFYESVEKIERFPFVVVAPLCEENTWFDMFERLKKFIERVIDLPFVMKNRVYVMGASMGGYCTWQLAMSMPEKFAAIVPICGGGMYWNIARMVNVPAWAFHGEDDACVLVEESKKMIKWLEGCGGEAKLTVYPKTGHNAWTPTYENQEVYDWLLSHEKNDEKAIINPYTDSKIYG